MKRGFFRIMIIKTTKNKKKIHKPMSLLPTSSMEPVGLGQGCCRARVTGTEICNYKGKEI